MRDHLVAYFAEHHRLVEADALRILLESPQPLVLCRRIIEESAAGTPVVTAEMVERLLRANRPMGPTVARPVPSLLPSLPTDVLGYSLIAEGFSPPTAGAAPHDWLALSTAIRSRWTNRRTTGS